MSCKRTLTPLILSACLLFGCSSGQGRPSGTESPITPSDSTVDIDTLPPIDTEDIPFTDKVSTITEEGSYTLTGNAGRIVIDADKKAKIELILDGASLTAQNTAAIYIKEADKVTITLANGSVNTVISSGAFEAIDENSIDGAIFSKGDLVIAGEGSLRVLSDAGNGIVSKDDLRFTGGTIGVEAAGHALEGKDAVEVNGGSFTLTAGKDGIRSENDEDAAKGVISITDGSFAITADGDGLFASSALEIEDGTFAVKTGGGAVNAEAHSDHDFGGFGGGRFGQTTQTTSDTPSTKGIKSDGTLTIQDGNFTLDTCDDAIHSAGDLILSGGSFTLASGDDGIHSDAALTISGGILNITESYEGIEAQEIAISGGDITLKASDDGLNAAGGNDQSGFGGFMGGRGGMDGFASDEAGRITISGGKLVIDASGDGVDSNGGLYVTGGETYVWGPTNSGNGPLDYGGTAQITGGIFVAVGAQGMAQNFGSTSTQPAMLITTGNASGELKLTGAGGTVLLSCIPAKAYQCALISLPECKVGDKVTVSVGDQSAEMEITSVIMGGGSGMGGMMPGGMGGMEPPGGFGGGGRPGGRW